ncbi:MAG: D-alanyl-D-alanine carboxypeptidase/D-alanyl-D-alanine-endopeptidase [Pyrinomonadaceae bacterium]
MMKTLANITLVSFAAVSFALGTQVGPRFSAHAESAKPTPTPRVLPSGRPAGVIPVPTPLPTPISPATPIPRVQTLEELQSKIQARVFSPEVRRGRVGVKIVSHKTGKVIFENDSDKYFMPASNMKNFTVAAALERLGPDFRFVTSVYAAAMPDATGTIQGDLRIFGRGDISISTAFTGVDYYKGLDNLADKIIAAGVKRVEGGIIGDDTHFKGFAIPGTWEWDDLQWYYGAEISALPLNDNAVDLAVTPGSPGGPCIVMISPANSLMQITNLCTTAASSVKRDLRVFKKLDRNSLEISGMMPVDDGGMKRSVAFTRPAELFVALLKQRLEAKGVTVKGGARILPPNIKPETQAEIARLESAPFSLIAAKTMKPSQNMYTETILWTLGEYARSRTSYPTVGGVSGGALDSSELGIGEVKSFLSGIGVPSDGIRQYDGSGLSRHDLITPSAVITLYDYMSKRSRYSQAWRDSLTIGGIDGTLSNRFKGTAAAGNIRGKTGTIDQVSALSGYVKTAGGEELIISLLVNGVAETRQRTALIDEIVVNLANFNGRID